MGSAGVINDLLENWQLTLSFLAAACALWYGVPAIGKRMVFHIQLKWWHWAEWFAVALGIGFIGVYIDNGVMAYFFFLAVPAFFLTLFVPFTFPETESSQQIAIYLVLVMFISLILI